MQINDVSINLVTNVNFLERFFPKNHINFQEPSTLILKTKFLKLYDE
jgi:hypothetical protein